jgi:ankyrin repeat protein
LPRRGGVAYVEAMRVLLAHQPNLALTDVHGETALKCAIRHQDEEIILPLIRAGASLDALTFAKWLRSARRLLRY